MFVKQNAYRFAFQYFIKTPAIALQCRSLEVQLRTQPTSQVYYKHLTVITSLRLTFWDDNFL